MRDRQAGVQIPDPPDFMVRQVCPDCQETPARDQRDGAKDGRCLPCHRKATNPRRRKPVPLDLDWWPEELS